MYSYYFPSLGGDSVTFTDLSLDTIGPDYILYLTCSSPGYDDDVSTYSEPIAVHEYPISGLMQKTSIAFKYTGTVAAVKDVLAAFDSSLGTATCSGCPPGYLP